MGVHIGATWRIFGGRAKTAKLIAMPFEVWTRVGTKMGSRSPHAQGQFLGEWTRPGMPDDTPPTAVQKD